MTPRRRTVVAAALLAAAMGAAGRAPAEEREDPIAWLRAQPLSLFDLGIMRLERDVLAAAPWIAEMEAPRDQVLAGVQYNFWRQRIVVYVSMYRPRAERTETNCVALFRRLVERMIAHAPEGPGRASWYLEKSFAAIGRERATDDALGKRLSELVRAEITLRGRLDDARAGEAGRMTCTGRFDANDAEIERVSVN